MVSEPTTSDRGFRAFGPVTTAHGDTVQITESSAANGPHLWLNTINGSDGDNVTAHLTLAAAEQIRDQLTWFLENHYQVDGYNPLALCTACGGTGTAPRTADGCRACTGQRRGPRRWRMGDAPPPEDVTCVADHTAEGRAQDDKDGWTWGRVIGDQDEWKGYKNGGKIYLDWAELVRRWGPVAEVRR